MPENLGLSLVGFIEFDLRFVMSPLKLTVGTNCLVLVQVEATPLQINSDGIPLPSSRRSTTLLMVYVVSVALVTLLQEAVLQSIFTLQTLQWRNESSTIPTGISLSVI